MSAPIGSFPPVMSATIIDGKAIASQVRAELAADIRERLERGERAPGLATILVGDDPASAVYIGGKRRACAEVGIIDHHRHLPAGTSATELGELIHALGEDPEVSGILLQLPVPAPLDGPELTALIPPGKDVDGLTPLSAGRLAQGLPGLRPCTPLGVLELLDRHGVALEGAEAVVVGRSDLVGKPLAALLLSRNATVTICHSRTRELEEVCRRAEVLIAAVGAPRLIGAGHVRPGAAVIDVGMNRVEGRLCGDVDFDAVAPVAGLLTPVPGGVGPMTIAMLLRNTLRAAELAAGGAPAR
jgi:methylenetetrahydrofolate dehydrogenase (NADP+)/methenyltetrahydrofolate cyclohydrolase